MDDTGGLQAELLKRTNSCGSISQLSVDSITSRESRGSVFVAAGDINGAFRSSWLTPTAFR